MGWRSEEDVMHGLDVVLDKIEAQQVAVRRYRRRHPVKYWRWLQTPEGRLYDVNMTLLRHGWL